MPYLGCPIYRRLAGYGIEISIIIICIIAFLLFFKKIIRYFLKKYMVGGGEDGQLPQVYARGTLDGLTPSKSAPIMDVVLA